MINKKVNYSINDDGEIVVHNPLTIEALYRFPDLTYHTIFLTKAIQSTINKDVPEELLFLQCYDELKKDIQQIVDMPNHKIDQMIIFLHQNKGELANRKRKRFFEELTDIEIKSIESTYLQIFEHKQIK